MRFLLLLAFLGASFNSVFAQLYCPPLAGNMRDETKFHISAGYGLTKLFGDIEDKSANNSAGYVKLEYTLFNQGIKLGVEGQFGNLVSEGINPKDERKSRNGFKSYGVGLSIYPAQLFKEDRLMMKPQFGTLLVESAFIEIGAYTLTSTHNEIYRDLNRPATFGEITSYDENGYPIFNEKDKLNILPSVAIGLGIPLFSTYSTKNGSYISIVPRAQLNAANKDNLDGYVPRDSDWNLIPGSNDMYFYYSLGVKYSF